jgi:histidine ammonia-lyase
MTNIHYITNHTIDFSAINKITREKHEIRISEEAKKLIVLCRDYLDEKIDREENPIYGITTGFGALHDISISKDQLINLQKNLIISHACGTGNEVDPEIVRLMLFLKAQALSYGHSGVELKTVERILDFYNNNICPVVYEQGSLGASGDLAPLAHLFLPMLGLGEVNFEGKKVPAPAILKQFNWKPIQFRSKEGLALLNGTQFMSAHGVLAIIRANKLSKLADIIAAISLEAYDGRLDPFMDALHQMRPHPGQIKTSDFFRKILEGSEIASQHKKHIQDPYSFRCIPQVHGASKDAIEYVSSVVLTEINSVTDNPTIFPNEDLIVSGGNFHGQPLALAFDFMCIALAELGSISERRVYRLISGDRDLPQFLVAKPGLNSGFMIPQYAAASIVSQNKQLCTPSSVDSIPSSNEQEDHVSMGANGATKLIRVVDNLERILAIELLNAAQALDFRKPLKTSPYLADFIGKFREIVPFLENDGIMYESIHKAIKFLKEVEIQNIQV